MRSMQCAWVTLLLATSCLAAACGAPQGPRVRFVQTSPQQLQALEQEDVVWYEFQPGDVVPLVFLIAGVAEGQSEQPVRLVATKPFWVVVFKDRPTQFSYDGRTIARDAGRVGVMLGHGGFGNQAGVLVYLGDPRDLPPDLR